VSFFTEGEGMEYPVTARREEFVRNIVLDLVLSVLTCFLYNVYVNYRQMLTVNHMLGTEKYSFVKWSLLTLVTCGLYHVYHEYIMSEDIAVICRREPQTDGLINVLLALFGLSLVADAIQQKHINQHFGANDL
jgi:hypothetical protein